MIYLSGCVREEVLAVPDVGVLITPNMGNRPDLGARPWAADNGCFAQGQTFLLWRYVRFLEETMAAYRATCLFATAPDVLGDARATWARSRPVLPVLRNLGYPAALVAQDGIEQEITAGRVEWEAFDVLFLGGTTRWKLSQAAERVTAWARTHGKSVHMGRVNSARRLRYAREIGCDSADGTYLKFGPDVNLPKMQRWLRELAERPSLWSA